MITGDDNETANDTFTFGTKLANGVTYTVAVTTQPAGKTCTVAPTGEQTVADGDVTDVTVTCILTTYSVGGTITRSADSGALYVILMIYDDNTGTGGTNQSVSVNLGGTFSFTGIPENKFYTLQASTSFVGEICSGGPTTPTQVTADVIGVQITCSVSTGPFIQIELISESYEAFLTTVSIFIGDTAITDTSGTATHVVNGYDDDVVIIQNYF